jgi:uncharacterized repeat protein (TIGR03803 family)
MKGCRLPVRSRNGWRRYDGARGRNGARAILEACEPRRLLSGSPALTDLASLAVGDQAQCTLAADSQGNLYGTTMTGGANNDGAIFEVRAGTSIETVLASFDGTNGVAPQGQVTIDAQGNLYGVASRGGATSDSVVWELAAGSGSITDIVPYSTSNGYFADGGLVLDPQGDLFGTASHPNNDLSIFEVTAGTHAYSILATLSAAVAGYGSSGALAMDAQGNLFGATSEGGLNDAGTIYELPAGGSTIQVLATFPPNWMNFPSLETYVTVDANGNVFVTQEEGPGRSGDLVELPAGSNTLQTIADLEGPTGSLLLDAAGDIFGTTYWGGDNGIGTAWEVPAGSNALTTLVSFSSSTGNKPEGGLVLQDGILYGTTTAGGANGQGTVFELDNVALPKLDVTTQPTACTAGQTLGTLAVEVDDASGNLITTYNSNVTLSIASGPFGATLGGTVTVAAVNGVATFNDLTLSTPGNYTLTASDGASTPATLAPIAAEFNALTVTAGTKLSPSVLDVSGLSIPNHRQATVTVIDSPAGSRVTKRLKVPVSGGQVTLKNLTFTKAGTYTVQISGGSTGTTETGTIVVAPSVAARLVFSRQPANVSSGTPFDVQVEAVDRFGNLVPSDTSTITVQRTGRNDGPQLAGTLSAALVDGVADFSELTLSAQRRFELTAVDAAEGLRAHSRVFRVS